MTDYLPPLSQMPGAGDAALLRRISVLEQRLNGLVAGAVVVTSTTRPTNPAPGMEIFETDTGAPAIYNGTTWLYQPVQAAPTQTLGSTQPSVTFTPAGAFTQLALSWRVRLSTAAQVDLVMQVDGDTGSHYLWAKTEASNGAASPAHSPALTTFIKIGVVSGTNPSFFGSGHTDIEGWSSSTGYLTCAGPYGNYDNAGTDWAGTASGTYEVAGPHTSLKIFPSSGSFAAGSVFSLYGLM